MLNYSKLDVEYNMKFSLIINNINKIILNKKIFP